MAVANTIDGIIKVFNSIPSTWNGTLNYNSINNTTMQYDDGFRDVVQPTYNTETQRKGAIFFDTPNDVYTYEVIDLTDDEVLDLSEVNDENEARVKIDNYRFKGGELIERTRTKMWRRVHLYPTSLNGLTKQQVAKLERWFLPTFTYMLFGNFRQAKNEITKLIEAGDDITGDSSLIETAGMLDTATWLKDKLTDYFNDKYDL